MKRASVCVLLNSEHGMLVMKRSPQSDWMPNKWGLVGGTVEPNETPQEAILREIKEETNLKVDFIKLIYSRPYGGNEVFIYIGLVNDYKNIKINAEHIDYGWFNGKEIKLLDTVPELINIIFKLTKCLILMVN